MSDTNSGNARSGAPRPAPSAGRILAIVLPVALVLAGRLLVVEEAWSRKPASDVASTMVARMFTSERDADGRQMAFPDADNDMVADPPADPAKLINPDTLVFSYVATTEEDGPPEDTWKELFAAIKEKTGKEVKLAHYTTATSRLAALKKGELHIVGLNTGLVQSAVEQDGFVPLCTLGQRRRLVWLHDGIPRAGRQPDQEAGRHQRPQGDVHDGRFEFGLQGAARAAEGQVQLAAGARLQIGAFRSGTRNRSRAWRQGKGIRRGSGGQRHARAHGGKREVDPAAYVSIYTSERFPPATIGYAYNLSPELRDGIQETLLKFDWKGTGLEKQFGPEGKEKFVPVNYKDDWANTRRIDQVIAEARKASASETPKVALSGSWKLSCVAAGLRRTARPRSSRR